MELNQLQYFQTVASMENISKAAELLHITQPALSRSISRLEDEVGIRLFERSGNSIRLSQAGVIFLSRVDRAVSQLRFGIDELRNIRAEESGSIHFAAFSTGLVTEPMRSFILTYPNISIRHSVLPLEQIKVGLEHGKIDFALTLSPIESPLLQWTPVAADELIIIASDSNPIAKNDIVSLAELANHNLALPDPNLSLRTLLEGFCKQAGFMPRISYEGNDSDMVMSMIRDNACVFVIPASIHIWKILSDRNSGAKGDQQNFGRPFPFSVIRIKDPVCSFDYGFCLPKEKSLSKGAGILHQYILDYFARWMNVRSSAEFERLLQM